jgi:hypothetical protein
MTTVTVDLINVISVIADPITATMTGTAVAIVVMTIVMTNATTTVATIAVKTTGMTGGMIAVMTGMMIVVAKTTITAMTTIARSLLHQHRQKGATPMVRSRTPTNRSASSSVVVKQARATDSSDQTQGKSAKLTYLLIINPIVDGAFLPKTLVDGGSSLNIIFTETLRKMDFDFSKMTACDEPFYVVILSKVAVGAKSAPNANHTASRTKLASHAQRANDVPVNFS